MRYFFFFFSCQETKPTNLVYAYNVGRVRLLDEAEDGQVEEEVHEEASRRGVRVSAADDHVMFIVYVAVTLL